MMAAVRFLVSGAILYTWSRSRGAAQPSRLEWRNCAIVGACLLVGGNGAVVWAEKIVPSGMAALLLAVLPFWIVLIEWLRPNGKRPGAGVVAGLIVGLVGLVILIGPSALDPGAAVAGKGGVQLLGAVVLILGSLSWALGSIFSQHTVLPRSAILATGMEMIAGGAFLVVVSAVFREPSHFELAKVSAKSIGGLVYLATFGSLIGFTAFIWLLGHQPPSRVATYAYVNPVVAVFLGWALAGEALTLRTAIAAAIIIGAVAIITTARSSSPLLEVA
jgi:drug/metabolite transporter (DMT)-like permease